MNNQPIDLNLLCQEKITEAHNIIMTPRGDYERAIEILTRLLNDLKPIMDNSTVSYSFNDDLESIIFYNRFAEGIKIIEEEYPLALIHYYIALAHSAENANDEAIAELKIAIRMNPFFMDAWIKKAELHEVNNEHDMMYQTITEAYNFIIDAQALSKFYIILGKYYMFLKNYQLANILISYSTYFNRNSIVEGLLSKIGQLQNTRFLLNEKDECINYLNKLKLPVNAPQVNLTELFNIFMIAKNTPEDFKLYQRIKRILWELTNDEMFGETTIIKDEQLGFLFEISDKWELLKHNVLPKELNSPVQLFIIGVSGETVINVDVIARGIHNDIVNEYMKYRNFLISQNVKILADGKVKDTYVQYFNETTLLNEKIIEAHNLMIIRDALIDIKVVLTGDLTDLSKLNTNPNVIRINKLTESFVVLSQAQLDEIDDELPMI